LPSQRAAALTVPWQGNPLFVKVAAKLGVYQATFPLRHDIEQRCIGHTRFTGPTLEYPRFECFHGLL
jgi:hypothetical protein